jgi:hypothetical protein
MNLGLGEALIFGNVSWSECTSSCIEWELQKTWMLGVVVVGGIYSPQPPSSRWGRLLVMGAPDSPVRHWRGPVHCLVRRHVTQPLGSRARSNVGGFVLTRHRTVRCHTRQVLFTVRCASDFAALTRRAHCSTVSVFCSGPLRELAIAPLAHRTVRWHTGQSNEL